MCRDLETTELSKSSPSSSSLSSSLLLVSSSSKVVGVARKVIGIVLLLALSTAMLLYVSHKGFRRSVHFWKSVAPMILEYKYLQLRHGQISCYWWNTKQQQQLLFGSDQKHHSEFGIADEANNNNNVSWNTVLSAYHERTAPKVVRTVMKLGGIYIKIGQFLSSVGSGLIDDAYVTALQPLQDGAPPRSFEEISKIVTTSLGIDSLEDIFESFDPNPIGAASIAQAHVAILKSNIRIVDSDDRLEDTKDSSRRGGHKQQQSNNTIERKVIVKVQYPEVVDWYKADFQNLQWVTYLLNPKNTPTVKALKERHERELDFRLEASNLQEVSQNMIRHGFQPKYITIPKVIIEEEAEIEDYETFKDDPSTATIKRGRIRPTQHVLIMEYIQGTSLADAMEEELNDIAMALGLANGKELKKQLQANLKQHFLNGGGEASLTKNNKNQQKRKNSGPTDPAQPGQPNTNSKHSRLVGATTTSLSNTSAGFFLGVLRRYASLVKQIRQFPSSLRNRITNILSNSDNDNVQQTLQHQNAKRKRKIDLGRVLKTLIKVHGYQVLLDGVYNADPHPGNVIIMNDGRLGLIDYGMVGRLTTQDRKLIASTVLAFVSEEKDKIVDNYISSGYRAGWISPPSSFVSSSMTTTASDSGSSSLTTSRYLHTNHTIYRFAKFHLDRIDLTPIPVETPTTMSETLSSDLVEKDDNKNMLASFLSSRRWLSSSSTSRKNATVNEVAVVHWPVLKLLSKSMEFQCPDWIGQMKRIGGLLIGVSSQAGRPISLSKEWYPIAKQCMETVAHEEDN